jgi:protein-S-isoprenylcysteine O-methyltransferase Ste14
MKIRTQDVLFVVLQFGLLAAIVLYPSYGFVSYPMIIAIVRPLLFIGGIIVGIAGVVGLRRSLSIFPTPSKKTTLVASGIYKYIRHPMYTGLLIIALSFTVCRPSLLGFILFASFYIVLLAKSSYEERLLEASFTTYAEYKDKTGRFFPRT